MFSIVIPTYNAASCLKNLLEQISNSDVNRVIISDGGSSDQSLEIAIKAKALVTLGASGRGSQLALGVKLVPKTDWLLFLHADSKLPPNWQDVITQHIEKHHRKAGYFDLRFNQSGFKPCLICSLANFRSRLFGLPYGDQGLLISPRLYGEIGGFDDMPLFEDVAIMRKLGKHKIRSLRAPLTTSADKYERDGYFKRGWRNFRLLRRYLNGDDVNELLRAYQ